METGRYPNKLKKYRRCAGYSQKKVAKLLGLTETSTISRWEHGEAIPGTLQVFRLSKLYDTLPHLLLEALWKQIASE